MNNKEYIMAIDDITTNCEEDYWKYYDIFKRVLSHHSTGKTDCYGNVYWIMDKSLNFKLKLIFGSIIK